MVRILNELVLISNLRLSIGLNAAARRATGCRYAALCLCDEDLFGDLAAETQRATRVYQSERSTCLIDS